MLTSYARRRKKHPQTQKHRKQPNASHPAITLVWHLAPPHTHTHRKKNKGCFCVGKYVVGPFSTFLDIVQLMLSSYARRCKKYWQTQNTLENSQQTSWPLHACTRTQRTKNKRRGNQLAIALVRPFPPPPRPPPHKKEGMFLCNIYIYIYIYIYIIYLM